MEVAINKICSRCGLEKPLDEFGTDKRRKDGHASICRACDRIRHREYYEVHRDRKVERQRAYREANPEKAKESSRKWKQAHKDIVNEHTRTYRTKQQDATNDEH